jgi:hypothetical protein
MRTKREKTYAEGRSLLGINYAPSSETCPLADKRAVLVYHVSDQDHSLIEPKIVESEKVLNSLMQSVQNN